MENNNQPIGTPQDNNNVSPESTAQAAQSVQNAAPQQPYIPYQAAQPAQNAVSQQAYNPYQTAQPVQNVVPQQTYNPYQTAYQSSVATTSKKSAGQIVALVFGIILTVFGAFWLLATIMVFIDDFNTYGEVEISIPIVIIFSLPLILGIILTVIGAKKKKQAVITPNYTAVPQPTAYTQTTAYASTTAQNAAPAPAQNVSSVTTPTAASADTSAAQSTAAPSAVPSAAPADTSATQSTAAPSAAPVNQVGQVPVTTASAYQYAPTATIQDDSKKAAKKSARNCGLVSIGISALMWILIFVVNYVVVGYVTILPILFAFYGLKSNIKSVTSWIAMIFSIITGILAIYVYVVF